jgi:hypothetical protein
VRACCATRDLLLFRMDCHWVVHSLHVVFQALLPRFTFPSVFYAVRISAKYGIVVCCGSATHNIFEVSLSRSHDLKINILEASLLLLAPTGTL